MASVEKVVTRSVRDGIPFWDAVPLLEAEGDITHKVAEALKNFRHQVEQWQIEFESGAGSMAELFHQLIRDIRYDEEINKQYKDEQQQAVRKGMVEEFVNSLAEYVDQARHPSVEDYLSTIALDRQDSEPDKDGSSPLMRSS